MILGRNWRIGAYNSTGVTCNVVVTMRPFKFGTDGALTPAASELSAYSNASLATTVYSAGTNQDNSSALNLGADILVTVTPSGTADGAVTIYLEHSTDGGTTWPSSRGGQAIIAIGFDSTSSAKRASLQIG